MKKILARAFSVLVCFVMLFSSAIPILVEGMEIGTTVSIIVEAFEITSQTEDCTLNVGDNLDLMIGVSQPVSSYKWERSTDGGTNWAQVASTSTCAIENVQQNSPANVPYKYRVTVENALGMKDSTIISVLVSDEYAYRTIELRDGDTDVSAYMHDQTRLVVTPLPESSTPAAVLQDALPDNALPLLIYDVSLVNQNNQAVSYFGTLQVNFHVGSTYNGQTLRAYSLEGGNIATYSGKVTNGILSVTVNTPSLFMVEVPAAKTHTVTVSAITGGSVTPSGSVNVADGTDKTFIFLPNAGNEVSTVTVDGSPVIFTGNSYTLYDITQDHTVNVSFQKVASSETSHTVTITGGSHGSVYPSGQIQVQQGSPQTVYFYPEGGYELDTVKVNGIKVNVIGNSYTLSAVTGPTTITASFRQGTTQPPNVYKTILASAGLGGRISPMGEARVEYGGDMYFYFIPNDGYKVDKVTVDGTATPVSGNFYHFINVIDDREINVTFKQSGTQPTSSSSSSSSTTYYTVTAGSGSNGSISPTGSMQVAKGGSQTFVITPDTDYEVDTLTVDGVAASIDNSSYSFANIKGNHSIYVTFKQSVTPVPPPPPPPTCWTITASSGSHGSISPEGDVLVTEGSSQTFYFIPDDGFEIDDVTIDGASASVSGNSYSFADVKSDHAIKVTFKKKSAPPDIVDYDTTTAVSGESGTVRPVGSVQVDDVAEPEVFHTVSVSGEDNGSISPSADVLVADGGSQTFYLIADDGYEVEAIYVNGEKQDVVGSQFTVDNITDDMQLSVTFKEISAPVTSDEPHCFICARLGRNIAPWCWLMSMFIVIALVTAAVLYFRRRRD